MTPSKRHWFGLQLLTSCVVVGGAIAVSSDRSLAQIKPDSTLGSESSQLTSPQPGAVQIDGGATRGTNLFHSFEQFSVPTGSSAYFNNAANIQNIFSRVTGGSISNIDGLIRANGVANLFLLNPHGMIFGPNASLNIGGSFLGSTASAVTFTDGIQFSATAPLATPLLTINIPLGLQFGGNQRGIEVQGNGQGLRSTSALIDTTAGLHVQPDRTLALVGGDVTLDGGTLKTAGGRIELGSVAGPGLVNLTAIAKGWGLSYPGGQDFGNIQLTHQAAVDASGEGGGDIQVQGGRLLLQNGSQIEASTLGAKPGGTLAVNTSDAVELSGQSADGYFPSGLFADVYPGATGTGGNLTVNTGGFVRLSDGAQVNTTAYGPGNAGNAGAITLTAKNDITTGDIFSHALNTAKTGRVNAGNISLISTQGAINTGAGKLDATATEGNGGTVTLIAKNDITTSDINSYIISRGKGNAGNISLTSTVGAIDTSRGILSASSEDGNGGAVSLAANGKITTGAISSNLGRFGSGNAGNISLTSTQGAINTRAGRLDTGVTKGNAGTITLIAKNDITTGDVFSYAIKGGKGNAGDISLTSTAGAINTRAGKLDATATQGNGGTVRLIAKNDITTADVSSYINSQGKGNAGNISLTSTDGVIDTSKGTLSATSEDGNSGAISLTANGNIITGTIDSNLGMPSKGNAGNISLLSTDGAIDTRAGRLDSGVTDGNAGAITLTAKNDITTGTIASYVVNSGHGNASNIFLSTQGAIDTSRGTLQSLSENGNAGAIVLSANGNIITGSLNSYGGTSGGGITLTSHAKVFSANSTINNETFGSGRAGDINIQASAISFTRGTQVSTVTRGTGKGGDINIQTEALSLTDGSNLTASTFGKGNAGDVTINARDSVSFDGEDRGPIFPFSGVYSRVETSATGKGGDINITTGSLSVTNGAVITTSTYGTGNAGNVLVNARDQVFFAGEGSIDGQSSGAFSAINDNGTGQGGDVNITVTTGSLFVTRGALLSTSTLGHGTAGNVNINVRDIASFDGQGRDFLSSGAYSTIASEGMGQGGNVNLTTGSLSVTNGAILTASTFGKGNAGSVNIYARDTASFNGAGRDSSSGAYSQVVEGATGNGGDVNVTARSLSVTNGASLSVSSAGKDGAAGNLGVEARSILLDHNATLSADTPAGQGNINLSSQDLILRHGSKITTDATGAAVGGNITINTDNLVAVPKEDSDIRANATASFGGQIIVNAKGIFGIQFRPEDTPLSDITASSALGPQFSGTVRINTPGIDPSRGLANISIQPVDASKQIAQGCPASVGPRASKFVVTGRGGLPPTPQEAMRSESPLADLGTPVPVQEHHASAEAPINLTSAEQTPLVEAQGWMINAKGEVVLTAQALNGTPHSSWLNPTNCHAAKTLF